MSKRRDVHDVLDDETKRRLLDALEELENAEAEEEAEIAEQMLEETREAKYGKSRHIEHVEAQEAGVQRRGLGQRQVQEQKQVPVALVISPQCPLCQLLSHYQPFRALVEWFHINKLPIATPEELPIRYPHLYRACLNYSTVYELATHDSSTWLMRYVNPMGFPPHPTVTIPTPCVATVEGPILFWDGKVPPDIRYILQTPPVAPAPLPRNIIDKSIYFKVATEIMRIHQKIVNICDRYGWRLDRVQLRVRTEPIDLTGQEIAQLGRGRRRRRGFLPFG